MSNWQYTSPIEYGARGQHSATVIVLHGLGDTGDGWSFLPTQLRGDFKHVKFVFPNAPTRPITLNMGMRMPGWYDIESLDGIDRKEDKTGLLESKRYIESLIEKEVSAGVPSERVVVAGFSQGGAVALLMLRSSLKLGGFLGMSTYLPLRKESPVVSEANQAAKILLCHGDADQVVAYKFGLHTKELLEAAGMAVDFRTYRGMGHSACPEELQAVDNFLADALPPL